jgi:hypothetical protein
MKELGFLYGRLPEEQESGGAEEQRSGGAEEGR